MKVHITKNLGKKLLIFCTLLSCIVLNMNAQQLLTQNFNFNDELVNFGWRKVLFSNNPIKTVSPGLTYNSYILSGIGNAAKVDSVGQDVTFNFNDVFLNDKITYTSFMLNVTKATIIGDYFFAYTQTDPTNTFKAKVYIKKASLGFYKIGIAKANETPVYGNDSFAIETT